MKTEFISGVMHSVWETLGALINHKSTQTRTKNKPEKFNTIQKCRN